MPTMQGLCNILKMLVKLLKEEKRALIINDGVRIEEIVKLKIRYTQELSRFKGLDLEGSKKGMDLIKEINSLQEVNLLLTKQSLSFQDTLLDGIAQAVNNGSNTYSSKGNYAATNDVNLLNKKV